LLLLLLLPPRRMPDGYRARDKGLVFSRVASPKAALQINICETRFSMLCTGCLELATENCSQ